MRRSRLKSKPRKAPSNRSSARLSLASLPRKGCMSPERAQVSPGNAYDAEDQGSPTEVRGGSVQGKGAMLGGEELPVDFPQQSAIASPASPVGSVRNHAGVRRYLKRDPDEDMPTTRPRDSPGGHRGERDYRRGPVQALLSDSSATITLPNEFSESDITEASIISPSRDADDYAKKGKEADISSPLMKKKGKRLPSMKARAHRHRALDTRELHFRHGYLGQKNRTIGSETPLATSHDHEFQGSSRAVKRRATPIGWRRRLRKKNAPKSETSPTPSSPGVIREADEDPISLKRRASTTQSAHTPEETGTASCALTLTTPSPPSTSAGRSPLQSWTSILTRDASGRTTPRTTAFLALLRRVSKDSPSREEAAPRRLDRLTTLSQIQWACDEPEQDTRSPRSPATVGASSTAHERRNLYLCDERDDIDLLQVSEVPLATAPYKIRTSKLPRFVNLKETQVGNRYGRSLSVIAIACVMILLSTLIAAVLIRRASGFKQITLLHLAEDLKKTCKQSFKAANPGCLLAVEQLAHDMDGSVDPCLNLDQFVCGRWRKWNLNRRTYLQESMDNLTANIHESFLYLLNNLHLYGHEEGSMAVFYNSCRSFLATNDRTKSTADVISALGLRRRMVAFNMSAGMQGLLDFVVGMSLGSGLDSVISVSSRAGKVYVDMGHSLRSSLGGARVGLYLAAALSELGLGNESLNPLLDIDNAVDKCVQEANTLEPFVNASVKVLDGQRVPGASFVHALNQALQTGESAYSPDSAVAVRCIIEIRATLATLAAADLREAYVYASVVLLAQVMRYAYILPHEAATSLTTHDVTKTCVKLTGDHFKALFPEWVTRKLVGPAALAAFHTMTKTLQQAFSRSATAKELRFNGSDLANISVFVVGESNITAWSPSSPAGATPTHYDNHFLLNVVRASRDGVGRDFEDAAVERQLGGEIVMSEVNRHWTVFVPADFLLADMMYVTSGPEVNFPTVGVWLLAQWIKAAVLNKQIQDAAWLPREISGTKSALEKKVQNSRERDKVCTAIKWRARESALHDDESDKLYLVEVMDEKMECTRQEASSALGRNVSAIEGQFLFFVNWALDVALLAAANRREHQAWWRRDDRRTWQLFLMRFCHTMCGDEATLDTCRYQALQSRQLALAFRCSWPPLVARC